MTGNDSKWTPKVSGPRRSEDNNLFFSLPDNILGFLCSWWLSVDEFCRLDTAVCNSVYRPRLLGVLEAGWLSSWGELIVDIHQSSEFLQWIFARRLKFTTISLEESYLDDHDVDSNFVLGYEICISQGGSLRHLELLEIIKYRERGRFDAGVKNVYCASYCSGMLVRDHRVHPQVFTDEMVFNISKSCTNITSLDIQAARTTRLTYRSFCSLLENCPCITSLSFGHTISLDDALYAIRKHCHNALRTLVISFRWKSNYSMGVDYDDDNDDDDEHKNDFASLPPMSILQSLTIANLGHFSSSDKLVTILQKCSCFSLSHISFYDCQFLRDCEKVKKNIGYISSKCNILKSVEFENCNFFENNNILNIFVLDNCRRLTEITIIDLDCIDEVKFCDPIRLCSELLVLHIQLHRFLHFSDDFFSAIANGCPLLTSVALVELNITRASILPILMECTRLKKLFIYSYGPQSLQIHKYIDDVVSHCNALEELLLPNDKRMLGHHFILQLRQYMHLPLAEKSSRYAQVLGLSEEQLGLLPVQKKTITTQKRRIYDLHTLNF